MNENFLNSFAFEQMVREYHKRYSGSIVNALQINKGEGLLLKVENIFNKVFRLFYLFDRNFKCDKNFNDFFKFKDKFVIKLKEDFKNCFGKDYISNFNFQENEKLNHKICINLILEIFKDILHINIYYLSNYFKERVFNGFCSDKLKNYDNGIIDENESFKQLEGSNNEEKEFYLIEEYKIFKIMNKLFDGIIEVFCFFYKCI